MCAKGQDWQVKLLESAEGRMRLGFMNAQEGQRTAQLHGAFSRASPAWDADGVGC